MQGASTVPANAGKKPIGRTHIRNHRVMEIRVWAVKSGTNYIPLPIELKKKLELSEEDWRMYPNAVKVCHNCLRPKLHLPACTRGIEIHHSQQPSVMKYATPATGNIKGSGTTTTTSHETTTTTSTTTTTTTTTTSLPGNNTSVASLVVLPSVNSPAPKQSKKKAQSIPQNASGAVGGTEPSAGEKDEDETDSKYLLLYAYANAVSERWENLVNFPKVYKGQAVLGKRNWMEANNVFSNRISFPDPRLLERIPTLKQYYLSAESFVCEFATIMYCDWEAFFGDFITSQFRCTCGKHLRRNGCAENFRLVKGMDLKFWFLKHVLYRCDDCKDAPGATSSFSSISPHIIEQLPPFVRKSLLLVFSPGSILSLATVTGLGALVENYVPFEVISSYAQECIYTGLLDREQYRMEIVNYYSATVAPVNVAGLCLTEFAPLLAPSAAILLRTFNRETKRQRAVLEQSFRMAGVGIQTFSFDMVHLHGNKGDKDGSIGLNNVVNNFGEILLSQGQQSRSLKQSIPFFKELNEVADILGVYTDDPVHHAQVLQSCFSKGDLLQIQKDSWHVINAFNECCKAGHALRESFLGRISRCLFAYDADDIQKLRTCLQRTTLSAEQIEEQMSSIHYLTKSRRVRRYLQKPEEMKVALTQAFSDFVSTGLFTKNMQNVLGGTFKLIDAGYLKDIEGATIYLNHGTEEEPIYFARRGTSMVENINLQYQSLHLYRFGVDTADSILVRKSFRISHRARLANKKMILLEHVTDPTRMNDFVVLYQKLHKLGRVSFTSNPLAGHVGIPEAPKEKWFSGFKFQNPYSSVGTALRALTSFQEGEDLELEFVDDNVLRRLSIQRSVVATCQPVPRGQPFSHDDERKLLRAILRSNRMIQAKKMIDDEGGIRPEFWQNLVTGDVNKLVNVESVTLQFNICLIDAHAFEESHIEFGSISIETENIKLKEMSHVRQELRAYAERVAKCSSVASEGVRTKALAIVPSMGSSVVHLSVPTEAPTASIVEVPVAPPCLPLSDVSNVNQSNPEPRPNKSKARTSRSESTRAPKKPRKKGGCEPWPCCGARKGHLSNCVFEQWRADANKKEIVIRLNVNGKEETENDALRRIWKASSADILARYQPNGTTT